jgi:hypothetical protein
MFFFFFFLTLGSELKSKGIAVERVRDEEFPSLPDWVPRPHGPSDYFKHIKDGNVVDYYVLATGAPYVLYARPPSK